MTLSVAGSARGQHQGFTLIELMIVVAVIAILAAIAIPSYQFAVVKSRRSVAQGCLTEAAQFMERFYARNLRYDKDPTTDVAVDWQGCIETSVEDHYDIEVTAATASAYTVTATPGAEQAAKDQNCGTMTIDESGEKTASITGDRCWK